MNIVCTYIGDDAYGKASFMLAESINDSQLHVRIAAGRIIIEPKDDIDLFYFNWRFVAGRD